MNWIKVQDRLPEHVPIDRYTIAPWVLVFLMPIPLIAIARFDDGKWDFGSKGYTTWDQNVINGLDWGQKVTHWMPLPKIPT